MRNPVSKIYDCQPKQWGLRGDPYLWGELQQAFTTIPLPCSEACFMQHFERTFIKITNHSFNEKPNIFVERYADGGMSSGYISPEFWKKTALPLLISNLHNANRSIE